MNAPPPPVLALGGPTACGKTATAIELARLLGGEIISADARQIYRYLDIGTAKASGRERSMARHHLIDFLEPDEPYDAGRFACDALRAVKEIRARDGLPIVAGGTGLYIRALLRGLDVGVGRDDSIRKELHERIEQEGTVPLHAELGRIDPAAAARIHPNDPVRIVRALEVYRLTGKPISAHHAAARPAPVEGRLAVLTLPKEKLYERIDSRFDLMMEAGFLEEVRSILDRGFDRSLPCFRSPGYRELISHLIDGVPLDEAVRTAKREHRRYAKRQLTWFRKERGAFRVDLDEAGGSAGAARRIAEWYNGTGETG